MKKSSTLHLFFLVFLIAIIVYSTHTYAQNKTNFHFLLKELGIVSNSHLKLESISDIPQGSVIRCWVIDPAKLDVFQKFEAVELKKIKGNKWKLKNPDTGNNVVLKIKYEEEKKIEIIKTASFISP